MHFLFVSAVFFLACATAFAKTPPNILLILADDLGYSDLGCYGSEIETPHLDSVAANGLRFTQFYNTARCWPTRSALLTGYYPQQIRRDILPGVPSGGRGKRPDWAVLLPELLRPAGYRSYHIGKWHIDGMPVAGGFDGSYYLKDQGRFFHPQQHWLDDQKLPPVPPGTEFYATTELAHHAIRMLQDHARHHGEQPFFQYLAFAAPHFPLHALPEDIARYQDTYRAGWNQIRELRWQRQRKSGLAASGVMHRLSRAECDLGPPYHFPQALEILGDGEVNRPTPWNQLTAEQQSYQATKMSLHAAMIHRMDIEIGRVFDQIREMGQWENTVVIFLSDNGASAEIMVRDDGHDPTASPGSAATYLCLGPGWSTTCNTPFRRHKTWTHEGGISTPLVVSWPQGIHAAGAMRGDPGHVIDIVPTLLDLAGVQPKQDAPALPGKSLVPQFDQEVGEQERTLWWYHDGHRAIRQGNWKAVAPIAEPWELYDLAVDRAESQDLALPEHDRLQRLVSKWKTLRDEFLVIATQDLSDPAKARATTGRDRPAVKAQEAARPNPPAE